MKTDVVLTMDEYLDQCCVWKPVSPPASDGRHVPITVGGDIGLKSEVHGCRCDRWGHPCPGCVKTPHEAEQNRGSFWRSDK